MHQLSTGWNFFKRVQICHSKFFFKNIFVYLKAVIKKHVGNHPTEIWVSSLPSHPQFCHLLSGHNKNAYHIGLCDLNQMLHVKLLARNLERSKPLMLVTTALLLD